MLSSFIIPLFIPLLNVAKGEPSLVVFNNAEPSASTVVTVSGRNFTLTCKVVNFTDLHFDRQVVWSKKANNSRFPAKRELKWPTAPRSVLSFQPVTAQDAGVYVCSSVKFNLSRVVVLVVKPEMRVDHLLKNKRQKRAQYGYGSPQWSDWNNRRKPSTETSILSFPDPMRDSFSNFGGSIKKKYKPTEASWISIGSRFVPGTENTPTGSFNSKASMKKRYKPTEPTWINIGSRMLWDTSNIATTSWSSLSYGSSVPKWNPDNFVGRASAVDLFKIIETNYPDIVNDNNNSKVKSEYGVLYFMAAVGGLLLFSGIMCMCIRNNPNLRMQMERSLPAEAVCPHPVCRIHRNNDPSIGCLLESNPYDTMPTPPPIVATAHEDFITVVTVDRAPENVGRSLADSPPSYDSSIRNFTHSPKQANESDLPPSYDEALANMMPTAPPNYFSLTGIYAATPDVTANCSSTDPPDVVLDAPRGFARLECSSLVGLSGLDDQIPHQKSTGSQNGCYMRGSVTFKDNRPGAIVKI